MIKQSPHDLALASEMSRALHDSATAAEFHTPDCGGQLIGCRAGSCHEWPTYGRIS